MCSGFSMHALIRVVRHLRDKGRLRKLQMDELQVRALIWVTANFMRGSKRGTQTQGTRALISCCACPKPDLMQGGTGLAMQKAWERR